MPDTEELRNAVITNLRACLISSKGGIPVTSLNNDYKQLLGETIPFKRLGYESVVDFLKSVAEIKLTNLNGALLVEASKTAASNHVTSLVQRQKRKKKSRRAQRPSQRRGGRPISLPPRFQAAPKISRRNTSREIPSTKVVPKNTVDSSVPPAPRYSNTLYHSANTTYNNPRHPSPAPPPPPPLLRKPASPSPPRMYHDYMSLPNYSQDITHSTQPYYPSQEPQNLYNHQHLLHPMQQYPIAPPIRNMNAELILKRQTAQLNEAIQQYEQMQSEKNEMKIRPKVPPNKSGGKPIIDRLPIPTNLSPDSYYNKLLDICNKNGWPDPEICLLKQKGGIVTCIVSLKFYRTGTASEASSRKLQDFSTYPDEIRDVYKALEEGSKKAYDSVLQMLSENHPFTKDRDLILERVREMVEGKPNGVWAFQIEGDYIKKFNEGLPPKWIEIVRDSGVVNASDLGHSYVVTPVIDEDKLKMVSPCSFKKVNLEIPKLIPPESDQWDVFLSKAYSFEKVWIRLIGENYSEQLENLTTEIELYYFDDKSPPISKAEIDHYYVAICDNSAYRVQVKELVKDSDEVFVHFIDYGDFEYLSINLMKQLAPKFYKLPAQALQVNLSGLEYCSKLEYRYEVMDKIIAKSYIAVVEERDPYYLVLYDTSENNDIDINKLLIDNIFSEILNKLNNLKVGTVKEVRICHIDDNGQVFIQLAATPVLEILEDRLASFDRGESETNISTKINFNKFYLVKQMGKHKRVIVNPSDNFSRLNVDVYFVDEGKTSTVAVSDLLEINDDYDVLHFMPNQALKIYLKDIPPFKLTKSKINKLREIAPPNISVISKVVEVTDLPVLELFIRNQTDKLLSSINHSIELEDLLESSNEGDSSFEKSFQQLHISDLSQNHSNTLYHSSSHINPSKTTFIHEQDIFKWDCEGDIIAAHRADLPPFGTGYFEIYVSDAANPDNFTVQPTKYLSELNKLTEEMTYYYDRMKPNVTSPLQYDVFAMKHTDGFWYRAVLYRVLNDSITVRLCDYGNLDIVPLKHLRPLHKKFMKLPFVGFKAALCGIAPKHRDWNVQDCVALKNMIKEKKLISIIKEVRQIKDEIVLFLEITDTTSNNDININHQLVIEGRAIYI